MRLFDCSFIEKGKSLMVTGSTGVGISYIASALGYQAQNGQSRWILSVSAFAVWFTGGSAV